MKFLDFTFETPAENLACDEALLRMCEGGFTDEILRFWEPRQHFVVLGYSNRIQSEVHLRYCEEHDIPVLRRCSGGGAVLQGPGCLNFALVLSVPEREPLRTIPGTNNYVMMCHKKALEPLVGPAIEAHAFSDLALGAMKFSGNAQRRMQRSILFHGTFLLDFDIPLIREVLPLPSKQPPYRHHRSHQDFLTNLQIPRDALIQAVRLAWNATGELRDIPFDDTHRLAETRYSAREWIFRS